MNRLLKLAVSSLVLGTALIGNSSGVGAPVSASAIAKADRQASKLAVKASEALKARDGAKAVTLAESAVTLDPRDADHRALLGQAYLLSGRFASAATAFRDALTLNPAHGRAALNLALAEIAYGRTDSAKAALEQARPFVPAADYGLALALAGDRDAAVTVLEAAARGDGATPKTRQNLALAYALAGRWKDAQVTAAQDVPADQMLDRMTKWAQFAKPQSTSDQVASLLGVKPMVDPGQPQQLALAPVMPEPVAVAAVAPVVAEPAAAAPVVEPTVVASVEPAAPVETAPVAPAMEAPKARAAQSVFFAAPVAKPAPLIRKIDLPASKPASLLRVAVVRPKPRPLPAKPGNFVVQLGAFSSASRVEAAWTRYSRGTRRLSGYVPVSTTFRSANATVHRLSVGGFATRNEAWALCNQVKASGGACFVRGTAGDAPMQFASRKAAKPAELASR